jgi:ABC-type antimicrobial peptide transport system permease subunit
MNPTSPVTYYRRHKRSALLQITLISLATVGLFVLVAVLDTIPLRGNVSYLARLSQVTPTGGALDPAVVSQIQTHPDVARAIPDNGLRITLPTLLGTDSQRLLGVSPEDAEYIMQHCGVRLKEGRMFEPRTNEIVLSEETARALGLELGSEIGREIDQDYYELVPTSLVVVGILEGDPQISPGPSVRLGFVSAEYLHGHELYAPRATSLLVLAKEGRKATVDDFLESSISSKSAEVETFATLVAFLTMARIAVYVIFGAVNSVVGVAMALVIGIINQIALAKRLNEFGLLHALGRARKHLTRRLTLETAAIAGLGYLIGLGIALAAMAGLKNSLFYNLGMELNILNPAPFFFVLPIPLLTTALTFVNIRRIFARLDAVAIVERGKLSEEPKGRRTVKGSSGRPLSSLTFYLRHRRRGLLMILGTAIMVVGITFPVFLLSAMTDAILPYMDYLQHVSVVAPSHAELDPGVVGQVGSCEAVARIIPAVRLGMQMVIPPGGATDVTVYGVSEADLPILLDLFEMQVQKGRLPRPRTNEIVLSAAIITNRGLHVGDVVGGDTDTGDTLIIDNLPTEMVITGILSPDRPWIGFASFEYLRSHELTASRNPRLLLIPRQGQKPALDRWLEQNIDPAQARIITYDLRERDYREQTTSLALTFALLECMIAAVAAVALATLNHIFFTQRREEFGVLSALGRSRRWLVLRTMAETGSVIGTAWLAGAVMCGIGLAGMQSLVYAPRGLPIDLFNLTPWLMTTPVPLAVALASAGTIGWVLTRLDPVAVIERR